MIKSIEDSFLWLLPMESECNKQVNEAREEQSQVVFCLSSFIHLDLSLESCHAPEQPLFFISGS